MKPMVCTFDPNDADLLRYAMEVGSPPEVRAAIEHAVSGFTNRLRRVDGADKVVLTHPATAFDALVIREALQRIADQEGRPITILWSAGDGRSPDVLFKMKTPTLEELISRFEAQIAASGGNASHVRTRRIIYKTHAEWAIPNEDGPSTADDWKAAEALADAFSREIVKRGARVEGQQFNRSAYDAFRAGREDTRQLRAEWVNSLKKLAFAFSVQHGAIGWSILEE